MNREGTIAVPSRTVIRPKVDGMLLAMQWCRIPASNGLFLLVVNLSEPGCVAEDGVGKTAERN